MARAQSPNIEILEIAAQALGAVCEDLVFLGGCATALLITDSAAPPVRVTRDVDTVAEIASVAEYHVLGKRLRKCGFYVDPSKDAPICRWIGHGIILDVMPTDKKVLGFTNVWYTGAINAAVTFKLPSGANIRLIDAAHFLATKLTAFDGRGDEDYVMSHDLEDVVCVLDGRPELEDEVLGSAADVRKYVCGRIGDLMNDRQFLDAIPGHLPGDPGSQARLPDLVEKLERLAAVST
ncbi:MAG: hypothetical protein AAFX56_06420 [Pseudomonadota bacterium]